MTLKSIAAIAALMAMTGGIDPHFERRGSSGSRWATNRHTGQAKIRRAAKKRRRQKKAKR
jgi:hypothetical protein